jgi:protein gp37
VVFDYEPALGPLDNFNLEGIDWMIVGAETGEGHREMDLNWARNMRDLCKEKNVAFFFKQGSHIRPGHNDDIDGEKFKNFPKY